MTPYPHQIEIAEQLGKITKILVGGNTVNYMLLSRDKLVDAIYKFRSKFDPHGVSKDEIVVTSIIRPAQTSRGYSYVLDVKVEDLVKDKVLARERMSTKEFKTKQQADEVINFVKMACKGIMV